jgi:hypothetical protein
VNAFTCVAVNDASWAVDRVVSWSVDITDKLLALKACIWLEDRLANAEALNAVICAVVRLAICLEVRFAN